MFTRIRRALLLFVLALAAGPMPLQAQRPVHVAPNAPRDRPMDADSCLQAAADKAIGPIMLQARATYPEARDRFLHGLPPRQSFFVVTELRDSSGRRERVFVAVDSILPDSDGASRIAGRIWNEIRLVSGYALFQPYTLPEGDVMDWLITRPDGTEEGNLIGNFFDHWQVPAECRR